MNNIELNAILYYADFLSLKGTSIPVTDTCKYFFIYGAPINSSFIVGLEPVYDKANEYFQQAYAEYTIIRDKFGEEGIDSFIDDICSIRACGSVDAIRMLKQIHQFSSKKERKQAFEQYNEWKNSQIYTHTILTEDGKPEQAECSKYFYHVEKMLGKSRLV